MSETRNVWRITTKEPNMTFNIIQTFDRTVVDHTGNRNQGILIVETVLTRSQIVCFKHVEECMPAQVHTTYS